MPDDDLVIDLGVGVEAFRTSGLLWALNTNVLHGAGYQARVDGDRLLLAGYGERVRQWPPDLDGQVDAMWRQYRQTLHDAQTRNNPGYYDGHSPGFSGKSGRSANQIPGGRR